MQDDMNKIRDYLKIRNYVLPALLIFVTSCNGQQSPRHSGEAGNGPKAVTDERPKMIRTQGVYSYMTHTGPHTDTSVSISAILEDKKGNIWLATMGEGVYCYNGRSFSNLSVKEGLLTNLVYSVMEDRAGNIWFGTTNGASRYNGISLTNFPFSLIRGNTPSPGDDAKEPNGFTEVWSLLQDRKGNIWLGTTNGVYCYDGSTFTNISKLDTSGAADLRLSAVSSMLEDQQGHIWFTSWHEGLCRFDGHTVTVFRSEGHLLSNKGLVQDKQGDIWIAKRGNGGLSRYDGKTFQTLLPGLIITDMKADLQGNLWLATFDRAKASGGLMRYDPSASKLISVFPALDGPPNTHITSVNIDRSGNVWLGTNKMTLSRYDGTELTVFISE